MWRWRTSTLSLVTCYSTTLDKLFGPREEGRGGEGALMCERDIDSCPLCAPRPGRRPDLQTCVVCRTTRPASQGSDTLVTFSKLPVPHWEMGPSPGGNGGCRRVQSKERPSYLCSHTRSGEAGARGQDQQGGHLDGGTSNSGKDDVDTTKQGHLPCVLPVSRAGGLCLDCVIGSFRYP